MRDKQFIIVEDDTSIAEFIREHVQQWGYKISNIVSSGEAALELLEGTMPDLVLMDIVLTGEVDGIDVAEVIYKKYHIPVIYLTAHSDHDKVKRAKNTLPYGYLVKPIDEYELRVTIETALYKAELDRELYEYKRWAHAVLFSIEDGVITTDRQGRVRFVNPKAESLLGCQGRDLLSKHIIDVIKFENDTEVAALERAVTLFPEQGEPENNCIEGLLIRASADPLPIEASVGVIQYEDNHNDGVIFAFRDISPQHQARLQLEQYSERLEHEVVERTKELNDKNNELLLAKQQAEQASSELKIHRDHLEEMVMERTSELEAANEELESFSYSVAHDLRSPLRSIAGFCHLLMEDAAKKLSDEEKNYLGRAIAAARLMAELIDDLLEFSKISRDKLDKKQVDLSSIAKEIVNRYQENKQCRDVHWQVPIHLNVVGDPKMLRIVLHNLFENAWKYTSTKPDAKIELGVKKQNRETVCYVKDNGVGFDMQYADKLFGVFQRLHTNKEFKGTGIGLATVQRIVQRHGGRVWATATVNKGATIYFTLNN